MTVFGVGCSDRDRIYTWADLKPKQKSADLVAYEIANNAAQESYRNWCKKVDDWIAKGEYDEMNEQEDVCKRLELHAQQLHKQMNCPHDVVDEIGSDRFIGGGWYHGEHLICRACGKEFRIHSKEEK